MNLMDKYLPGSSQYGCENQILISQFREKQIQELPNFLFIAMNYLRKLSEDKLKIHSIHKQEVVKYLFFHTKLIRIMTHIEYFIV